MNNDIQPFISGIHNLLPSEIIPKDSSVDSSNWITQDGRIKLANGRSILGVEGASGAIYGEIFAPTPSGGVIHYRKTSIAIQRYDGSSWIDVVTGLSASDCTFANYTSTAGWYTYAFGPDGVYKMSNSNPGTYMDMYDEAKNFKGYALIDKGRALMWGIENQSGILRGSYTDAQSTNSNYTSVTGEVLAGPGFTNYSGTLAFKGSTVRNCFSLVVTGTTGAGVETFTDQLDGTLEGSLGGTGTINYITGVYNITFNGAVTFGNVTATYQYENSNESGVTDFTYTVTGRLAGEGYFIPQDEGGGDIKTVMVFQDGYYSFKPNVVYVHYLDDTDTQVTNKVFRSNIGIKSLRGAYSTGQGVVFMDLSNEEKPELTILQLNISGDTTEPFVLFPHFKFSNYTYDDCAITTYERYIVLACAVSGKSANDTLLLCNKTSNTVDVINYDSRTLVSNGGELYGGSSLSQTSYNLLTGFDDIGSTIDNYWTSKAETYSSSSLKKFRKLILRGNISRNQSYNVYIEYDGGGFSQIGVVEGTGSYVDNSEQTTIGGNIIGTIIGGGDTVLVSPYELSIKITKCPKFRKRTFRFEAIGFGYVDIEYIMDWEVSEYESKLPDRFRQKQNVSIDGETNQ
jgi:hypothetical protein